MITHDFDEIRRLLVRYMDGESSQAEQKTLAEFFSLADELPDDLEDYRVMFHVMENDALAYSEEEKSEIMDVAVCDVANDNPKEKRHLFHVCLKYVAVAALVAIAFLLGRGTVGDSNKEVVYVSAIPDTVRAVNTEFVERIVRDTVYIHKTKVVSSSPEVDNFIAMADDSTLNTKHNAGDLALAEYERIVFGLSSAVQFDQLEKESEEFFNDANVLLNESLMQGDYIVHYSDVTLDE